MLLKILKIETAFGPNDTLIITVPNDPPEEFSIPLYPTAEDLEDMELVEGVTLFRSTVDGYAVSSEIDEALSVFLKTHVRLILKGPTIRFSLSDPTNAKVDSEHKRTSINGTACCSSCCSDCDIIDTQFQGERAVKYLHV